MGRTHPRHNPEEGAAAVVVRLRRGYVVVTREDDGSRLLESPALEGDWDRLWAVLESFGGGPVARTARTTGEDVVRPNRYDELSPVQRVEIDAVVNAMAAGR